MLVSETQRIGLAAVVLVSLVVYGVSLFNTRQPGREATPPWGSQGPALIAVEVSGTAGGDGIYFLPEGVNPQDVLRIAGVPEQNRERKIDPDKISDGSVLTFSPQGAMTIGDMAAVRKLALGLAVDLNRISEAELFLVPGIGERMASQIIELRTKTGGFSGLEDLTALPGIKEKKLNALRGYLMVRTP
ncbi:MAG: helix-hairpin-helix domain-containing protein [Deltaproteobacteria bacterium]|nr:helix-hairpin-helix domain-containing protein [Deltaproteobacteria bacterium]